MQKQDFGTELKYADGGGDNRRLIIIVSTL